MDGWWGADEEPWALGPGAPGQRMWRVRLLPLRRRRRSGCCAEYFDVVRRVLRCDNMRWSGCPARDAGGHRRASRSDEAVKHGRTWASVRRCQVPPLRHGAVKQVSHGDDCRDVCRSLVALVRMAQWSHTVRP